VHLEPLACCRVALQQLLLDVGSPAIARNVGSQSLVLIPFEVTPAGILPG
jgi:hypothetical protein